MVVGQERGPLVPVRAKNRDKWAQTNRDQCSRGPCRPPGLSNRDKCLHWSRFVAEPGLMGWPGPNESPFFLLVLFDLHGYRWKLIMFVVMKCHHSHEIQRDRLYRELRLEARKIKF